jgi:hypothetical protein
MYGGRILKNIKPSVIMKITGYGTWDILELRMQD